MCLSCPHEAWSKLSATCVLQEVTAAATEAQLGIEHQRAEILQASLESRQAQEAAAADASGTGVREARQAACEAARLAEHLQQEVGLQCWCLLCT